MWCLAAAAAYRGVSLQAAMLVHRVCMRLPHYEVKLSEACQEAQTFTRSWIVEINPELTNFCFVLLTVAHRGVFRNGQQDVRAFLARFFMPIHQHHKYYHLASMTVQDHQMTDHQYKSSCHRNHWVSHFDFLGATLTSSEVLASIWTPSTWSSSSSRA